ncbi:hypothetical protein [Brucella intermedia]|uniref:hypothetical protein n=1 Tax=Brucella intermedia TaxID=94625 RepID=UPI00178C3DF8
MMNIAVTPTPLARIVVPWARSQTRSVAARYSTLRANRAAPARQHASKLTLHPGLPAALLNSPQL